MRGTRRWRSFFLIRYSFEELSREGRPFIPVDAHIAGGVAP